MLQVVKPPTTLAAVVDRIAATQMPISRRRDLISGINRICAMAGVSLGAVPTDVTILRELLRNIRPARHDVTAKTFSNLKSLFRTALADAGVIDTMPHGLARRDPQWRPLLQAIKHDKRQSTGLAAFVNWCAQNGTAPDAVDDVAVLGCLDWLETKTLCPRPRDIIRRVPHIWNEARVQVAGWPQIELTSLSFRQRSEHLAWEALSESFRADVEAYLAMRAAPDLFDEHPDAPRRLLVPKTLTLQRTHLRLAASILVKNGTPVEAITALTALATPEALKTVLRHYLVQAEGTPNAFAVGLGKTILQVARYHCRLPKADRDRLNQIATRLPSIPFDLTEKNKALLRELESARVRAKLLYLPGTLADPVRKDLEAGPVRFVDAQVALAVEILLGAPLRPQNLIGLNWRRHFQEPDGPRGRILLHIPKQETKTREKDLVFELSEEAARLLRWYRRQILPHLGADPDGDLFVTEQGERKAQETITDQIIDRIEAHVGIHMTPHQFRHVAAAFYLEAHPEDFATVQALLGHASARTTLIYAGAMSRRAGRVYADFVGEQRDALKLQRHRKRRLKKA